MYSNRLTNYKLNTDYVCGHTDTCICKYKICLETIYLNTKNSLDVN